MFIIELVKRSTNHCMSDGSCHLSRSRRFLWMCRLWGSAARDFLAAGRLRSGLDLMLIRKSFPWTAREKATGKGSELRPKTASVGLAAGGVRGMRTN